MSGKRPTTYVQWRDVLHGNAYNMAMWVSILFARDNRVYLDRVLWKYLHRHRRLKRRLEAEFEAMDATCAEALLNLIFKGTPQ